MRGGTLLVHKRVVPTRVLKLRTAVYDRPHRAQTLTLTRAGTTRQVFTELAWPANPGRTRQLRPCRPWGTLPRDTSASSGQDPRHPNARSGLRKRCLRIDPDRAPLLFLFLKLVACLLCNILLYYCL